MASRLEAMTIENAKLKDEVIKFKVRSGTLSARIKEQGPRGSQPGKAPSGPSPKKSDAVEIPGGKFFAHLVLLIFLKKKLLTSGMRPREVTKRGRLNPGDRGYSGNSRRAGVVLPQSEFDDVSESD